MYSILVTGSSGQLGSSLKARALSLQDYRFIFTDIEELDITSHKALERFFAGHNIKLVINCAAYTDVDRAEQDVDKAMLINHLSVANLATLSSAYTYHLLHISTDYVFDGKASKPYRETDTTHPATIYGLSKLRGEEAIMASGSAATILRTSWLYSETGHNFVKTILKKARERNILDVVDDQFGSPTYAGDLADAIMQMLPGLIGSTGQDLYHYANQGVCSWYDFAGAIVEIAGIDTEVRPVASSDYITPAPRPGYSVLDTSMIRKETGISIPFWKDSLIKYIKNLE